jgi:succinoglycan biosynthesis protein ExoA
VYLGVFRREVLDQLGGYNESFDRAQDWELNYRIRQADHVVWFSPRLAVSYRPRPNIKTLARQYFHYGRWRRVVMRQHHGTANLRYLAPPTALLAVTLGALGGLLLHPIGWLLPAGYATAVFAGSLIEGRCLEPASWIRLPLVLATMHACWAAGFLTSPTRLVPRGDSTNETANGGEAGAS